MNRLRLYCLLSATIIPLPTAYGLLFAARSGQRRLHRAYPADLQQPLHRLPQLLQRALPAQSAELFGPGARRHQAQRLRPHARGQRRAHPARHRRPQRRRLARQGFLRRGGRRRAGPQAAAAVVNLGPGIRPCSRGNRSARASCAPVDGDAAGADPLPNACPSSAYPTACRHCRGPRWDARRMARARRTGSVARDPGEPRAVQPPCCSRGARLGGIPQRQHAAPEAREPLSLRAPVPGAPLFHVPEAQARRRSTAWCDHGRCRRRRRDRDAAAQRRPRWRLPVLPDAASTARSSRRRTCPTSSSRRSSIGSGARSSAAWDVKNQPGYADEPPATRSPRSPTSRCARATSSCSTTPTTRSAHSSRGRCATAAPRSTRSRSSSSSSSSRPTPTAWWSPPSTRHAKDLLILPGAWGSDVPLSTAPFLRASSGIARATAGCAPTTHASMRPDGYGLGDIWDGDGDNPNALLTVFRHFDNAAVVKGAAGDLSKTVFVLDYPLFERLVYNLVVNFDVYGNVGHQSLTRLYMDMIRMEAEELFLSFLPPARRLPLRRTGIAAACSPNSSFIICSRCSITTRRPPSTTATRPMPRPSWSSASCSSGCRRMSAAGPIRSTGRRCCCPRAYGGAGLTRRSRAAPHRLGRGGERDAVRALHARSRRRAGARRGRPRAVYSIVHNREHDNVSWILARHGSSCTAGGFSHRVPGGPRRLPQHVLRDDRGGGPCSQAASHASNRLPITSGW